MQKWRLPEGVLQGPGGWRVTEWEGGLCQAQEVWGLLWGDWQRARSGVRLSQQSHPAWLSGPKAKVT